MLFLFVWFFVAILAVLWFLAVRKFSLGEHPKFWTQIPDGFIIARAKGGDIVDVLVGNLPLIKDRDLNLWTQKQIMDMDDDQKKKLGPFVAQNKTVMSATIGAYWMGLWPWYQRFGYKFEWNEYEKDPKGPGYIVTPRGDTTTRFLYRGTYAFFFKEVETRDGFKIDTTILVTFQARNIRVAWRLNNWLTTAESRVSGKFTDLFRTLTVEDVRQLQAESKKKEGTNNLFLALKELNGELGVTDDLGNPGLIDLVGNEIISASLHGYEVQGTEEEQNALALKKLARIGAQAEVETAKGDRRAKVERAKGESEADRLRLKPFTEIPPALANSFLFKESLVGFRGRFLSLGSGPGFIPAVNVDDEEEPKIKK